LCALPTTLIVSYRFLMIMSGWRMGIDEDPAEYNDCKWCGESLSLCSCYCRNCGEEVVLKCHCKCDICDRKNSRSIGRIFGDNVCECKEDE